MVREHEARSRRESRSRRTGPFPRSHESRESPMPRTLRNASKGRSEPRRAQRKGTRTSAAQATRTRQARRPRRSAVLTVPVPVATGAGRERRTPAQRATPPSSNPQRVRAHPHARQQQPTRTGQPPNPPPRQWDLFVAARPNRNHLHTGQPKNSARPTPTSLSLPLEAQPSPHRAAEEPCPPLPHCRFRSSLSVCGFDVGLDVGSERNWTVGCLHVDLVRMPRVERSHVGAFLWLLAPRRSWVLRPRPWRGGTFRRRLCR